jgi:hypothetical protein
LISNEILPMISETLAAMRTHRNRIHRYRRLLETEVAGLDRQYVERRLSEERCALDALVSAIFPLVFKFPKASTPPREIESSGVPEPGATQGEARSALEGSRREAKSGGAFKRACRDQIQHKNGKVRRICAGRTAKISGFFL